MENNYRFCRQCKKCTTKETKCPECGSDTEEVTEEMRKEALGDYFERQARMYRHPPPLGCAGPFRPLRPITRLMKRRPNGRIRIVGVDDTPK